MASVESDAPENFKQLLVDTGDGGSSTVRYVPQEFIGATIG